MKNTDNLDGYACMQLFIYIYFNLWAFNVSDVFPSDKNPYNEELIKALQSEVAFYKVRLQLRIIWKNTNWTILMRYLQGEHEILRKEVYSVAETNKELFHSLQNQSKLSTSEDFMNHKKVSDQVVHNLKVQIQLLSEVNHAEEYYWAENKYLNSCL